MSRPVIERIHAVASLDHVGEALADARSRAEDGDSDMAEWVAAVENGEACVVQTTTTATVRDGEQTFDVSVDNHGIWVEHTAHPATSALQIHETLSKDLGPLAEALQRRGLEVNTDDLTDMLIGLDLDGDLLSHLRRNRRFDHPEDPDVVERD